MKARRLAGTTRKITQAGLTNSSARLVPPESVILSSRAPIGHLAINRVPMAFNQGCRGLVPGEQLDTDFLYFFLYANREKLNDLGTGATFKELSTAALKSVSIPLPPLAEQRRIVAILDEAFEGLSRARANAEANLESARELTANVADSAFELVSESNQSELLERICTARGITYGVIKLGDHDPKGTPCLRTSNVRELRIDIDGMKLISDTLSHEYRRTILEGGEVLVNVRGTLGGVATVPAQMAGWNISREVAMVPVDHKRADPDYVSYFISTKKAQSWLTGVVKGAAYKGINLIDLRKLEIPLPSLKEQRRVVSQIAEARAQCLRVVEMYSSRILELNDLRHSLLQKAFAGELAVKEFA